MILSKVYRLINIPMKKDNFDKGLNLIIKKPVSNGGKYFTRWVGC